MVIVYKCSLLYILYGGVVVWRVRLKDISRDVVEELAELEGFSSFEEINGYEIPYEIARLVGFYPSRSTVWLPRVFVKKIENAREVKMWVDKNGYLNIEIVNKDGSRERYYVVSGDEGGEVMYDSYYEEEDAEKYMDEIVNDLYRHSIEDNKAFLRGESECMSGYVYNENPDGMYAYGFSICKD